MLLKQKVESMLNSETLSAAEVRDMLKNLHAKAFSEEQRGNKGKAIEYFYQGIGLFKEREDVFSLLFYSKLIDFLAEESGRVSEAIAVGEALVESNKFKEVKDPFILSEKSYLCHPGGGKCWVMPNRSLECTAGIPSVYSALAEAYYNSFQYQKAHEAIRKRIAILDRHKAPRESEAYRDKVKLRGKIQEKLSRVRRAVGGGREEELKERKSLYEHYGRKVTMSGLK